MMTEPSVRRRLERLASLPEREIDLGEGALLIAAEEQPGLDPRPWLRRLDDLAADIRPRLEATRGELRRVALLTEYLFHEVGLRGNVDDYYDPRNSLLNQVLQRRLGIPITLSVVCLEVGRRVGVDLVGIGFPGHFLVRHAQHSNVLLDPFAGGRLITEEDCGEILERVSGGKVSFDPRLLRPFGPRQILVRMLNNLRAAYLKRGEIPKAISALDRILLLEPEDPGPLRDRGMLLAQWGDPERGIEDLERYLEEGDLDPADHDEVVRRINEVRSGLGRVH
jgi:regulator of sirC expression with transglutaminase-like and TPR domain